LLAAATAITTALQVDPCNSCARKAWSFVRQEMYMSTKQAGGSVISWGTGRRGELGHANDKVVEAPRPIPVLVNKQICQISAGYEHVLAISADGELYTWGCGKYGRLGHGDSADRH